MKVDAYQSPSSDCSVPGNSFKALQTRKVGSSEMQRLERVLSWQSSEGWFMEYEAATLAIIPDNFLFGFDLPV